MKKVKKILLTSLCFFLGTLFAQSQAFSKLMYWNGKNLEMVYAKIDTNNGELKELHYQTTVHNDKVKLQLKKKATKQPYFSKWTAIHPDTRQNFEVSLGMTIIFTYANGETKEFLYAVEYINKDEKIIMGSIPFLGNIIYQKGNNTPELWLESADLKCKEGKKEEKPAFLCNFITPKGEELQLMIDQHGNSVTLWRNEKMLVFKEQR